MSQASKPSKRKAPPKSGILDDVLQLATAPEFRIGRPRKAAMRPGAEPAKPAAGDAPVPAPDQDQLPAIPPILAAEVANCLWYVKTRHFKQTWTDEEPADEDPRVRRTLGRINRGIKALTDADIKLIDPTGTRYPTGGEGLMRPIQFTPTPGMAVDTVSETVRPIVFLGRYLIQRGEVFVAVPVQQSVPPDPAPSVSPGAAAREPAPFAQPADAPEALTAPAAEDEGSGQPTSAPQQAD